MEEKKRNEETARRKASRPARFQWRSFLKGRRTKGVSLVVLLAFIFILYYYSDSSRSARTAAASFYGYQPTATTTSAYASPTKTAGPELATLSLSEAFWRTLNPRGFQSIRIGMPPSSIAILPRAGHSMLPADIRRLTAPHWNFRLPSLTPLWNFVKLVIIPQAATALALYGLLLYLLKDSDLLASQRNRLGRGEAASDDESDDGGGAVAKEMQFLSGKQPPMATQIGVHMLPASHESDIDVIAASADGRLALSVGVDNSICLWRFSADDQAAGTREMVPTELGVGDPIVGAAVSRDRMWVAVVSRCGRTQFWRVPEDDKTESVCCVKVGCGNGRVTSVLFDDAPIPVDDPFTASPVTASPGPLRRPTLLVVITDGSVRALKDDDNVVDLVPPAKDEGPYTTDVFAEDGILDIIVRSLSTTTLWSREHGEWSSMRLVSSLDEADRVVAVGHAPTRWRGHKVRLIALGHRSGNVEIIDTDGELVTLLALSNDPIRAVDIGAPHSTRCTSCDIHSTEGFYVIASTSSTVYVDRIVSRTGGPFCRCAPARRAQALEDAKALIRASVVFPPMPVRNRCLSNGFSNTAATAMTVSTSAMGTPVKSSLAPPGDFPVSSHGARRLSGWREENRPPSPLDRSGSFTGLSNMILPVEETAQLAADSRWMDAGILPLGGVEASEGGWVLVDNVVVGLLRKGSGIDDSQWELWALDLASPWNGFILMAEAVSLDMIQRKTRGTSPRNVPSTPSDAGELSMRARRAERMLSMNGRASFPSSTGSFTVPTHQPLGYVSVRPFTAGGRAVLAGFGNRVGVLTLPPFKPAPPPTPAPKPAIAITTPQRNGLPTPPPPQQPPPPPPPQLQLALPPRPPRRSHDPGSGNGNGNGASIVHSPAKIN